jgi:CheY-like chemotaxis protein
MSNELVLVVEDEFAIAELLEMALIDRGFRVVMAANGRQGLQCLAQGPLPVSIR